MIQRVLSDNMTEVVGKTEVVQACQVQGIWWWCPNFC